jgi:hypothetical protein
MNVRLFCEGNWDGRIETAGESRGAAVIIVERIIVAETAETPAQVVPRRLPKLTKGGGLRKKMALAMKEAEADKNVDLLVVLVDRDKEQFKGRLQELEASVDENQGLAIATRTVAGMAIEELEAWLIADHNFLQSRLQAEKGVHNPESVSNPKAVFHQFLDQAGIGRTEGYDLAAESIDFKIVADNCKAFGRFRTAIGRAIKISNG